MEKTKISPGDNVIIIDAIWKSVIGKSAHVCETNDSTDPEKLKVDFENGFVGYFKPEQLILDNDLTNLDNTIRHLKYMSQNKINKLDDYQIENMLKCLTKIQTRL